MSNDQIKPFPRGALLGAGVLIALTITVSLTARLTGNTLTDVNGAPAAKVMQLRFEDRPDGGIVVFDAERDTVHEVLPPGSGGFVRTVMRSLARDRRQHGEGREPPFRLTRWTDGRLTIDDPTTGSHIDLGAFGSLNTASFARLLTTEQVQ